MKSLGDLNKSCLVTNKKGVHARAAAQIVSTSSKFESQITVTHQSKSADSLSLIKLLTLDAPQGSTLEISATGSDAALAIKALTDLIESGFGELD